jgi:membrane protein
MKVHRSIDNGLLAFLEQWLSGANTYASRGAKRHVFNGLRGAVVVLENFLEHKCLLRASALSFTTILSLVPFLALAFAILKGFGVHNVLEPLVVEHLAVGSSEIVTTIISYINNTKMASLGAIGLAVLIVTVISLLGSIEESFNDIWGVEETRSTYRKFSDYLSVVVSGPILLLAAMSITTSFQSQSLIRWLLATAYLGDLFLFSFRIIPYVSIWIALVCLYSFMPNTRVRFVSALVGGILAGTAWQIAQWGFVHFQIGVAKYNAIYGTLSALPVFMVWIYTSWVIVLFGVEVVVAHQSRKTFLHDYDLGELCYATREATALVILLSVVQSFFREERPWTGERLADELRVPVRTVRKILSKLVAAGYLVVAEGEQTYYPARDPEHIRVGLFLRDLRHQGKDFPVRESDRLAEIAREMVLRRDNLADEALKDLTLKDLVEMLAT